MEDTDKKDERLTEEAAVEQYVAIAEARASAMGSEHRSMIEAAAANVMNKAFLDGSAGVDAPSDNSAVVAKQSDPDPMPDFSGMDPGIVQFVGFQIAVLRRRIEDLEARVEANG